MNRKIIFGTNQNLLFALLFVVFTLTGIARHSRNLQGTIWSDTEGYYMYLPAVFIQQDLHHIKWRSMDYRKNNKGEIVIKYTCGLTGFYLPFFLAANGFAHVFHYDTSGFSTPYYYAMIVCGAFWAVIGLYLLQILLRRYFSFRTTWLTLICVMLGTNFFHYATKDMGMSHIYSFLLITALLLAADSYYKWPSYKLAIGMAFLFGWVVLIRPTNIVVILPVLLWRTASWTDIKARAGWLRSHIKDLRRAIPFFILPIIPQLCYWKEMTGKWILYSYEGEGFIYWKEPKITAVLYDPLNGLFLYSPILLLALPAVIFFYRDRRGSSLALLLTFAIITYLFASWWAWNFAAAFGHRAYVEFFPLFAFPLAIMAEHILALKSNLLKAGVLILVCFLVYYSVTMSLLNDYDSVTGQWNWDKWRALVDKALTLRFVG